MEISIRRLSTIPLIWILALLGVTVHARAQGYIFNQLSGSHTTYGSGNGSLRDSDGIAQGDFNGDGRLDFAVMGQFNPDCGPPQMSCSEIQIYLAQSNGTYALTSSYQVSGEGADPGGISYSITVGDVNGDGKPDLVYAAAYGNNGPPLIVVQFGNGDGTFQNPIVSVTPASNPCSLILGDFNGDGKLDLAVPDRSANNVYVQLGNGDGSFQSGTPYTVPGLDALHVVTADLNRDGKLDLVVTSFSGASGYTSVLLGNGDGTFGPPVSYPVGAYDVGAADLNGDGILDLVVSGSSGGPQPTYGVSVLLGNGDGTFGLPITTAVPGNLGGSIITADFNGDGITDVAMAGAWTGIVVLLGNNDGTFKSPPFAYGDVYVGDVAFVNLVAGDYNLDGKVDLAAVGMAGTGEPFSILTNNGDGTFSSGEDLTAGTVPTAVVTGDFNGDGKLDFAVTNGDNGGSLRVYLGNGNGTFQAPQTYITGPYPEGIVAADFNHDGALDLAMTNNNNTVSIFIGVGDGTFVPGATYTTGSGPATIAVGDLNNDGKLDFVIGDTGDSNITLLLGNGDGTFQPATYWNVGGTGNSAVAISDFNRDGNVDIAISSINSNRVALLLGNGDGSLQMPTFLALPSGPQVQSVASADLRKNGISDLVVSVGGNTFVGFLIYLGNGDGTFARPIQNFGVLNARSIVFGDFDGDGRLDMAFASSNSAAGIVLGNGDGTFQPEMQYEVPRLASNIYCPSIAVGDFNSDGSLDLAALSWGPEFNDNGFVTILLSNPVVVFSASKLSFGNINVGSSSGTMNLTVTNQSPTNLTLSGITITGANSGDFTQTTDCGSSLAGGASCNVSVVFSPTYAGARTAAVTVTDTSAGSPLSVILSGTGTGVPIAAVSPSSLTFSNQDVGTTSSLQTATLSNTGSATLSALSIVASSDFAQTNNCGSSVAPGATCIISVTFKPGGTGTRTGSVTITDNASDSPQLISLSGTGTQDSTTTLLSAPTVTYNANGAVTVTVTSSLGTVTGNVTLSVDGATPISQPLSGGSTIFTLTNPNAGDHALSASYAAQGIFAAASAIGSLHVDKATATVTLGNLTQTYTGGALTPSVTTNPASLTVVWTGAPDTSSGSYPVTATVNDPNYQGSASETFTINKATPTLTWANPADISFGTALSATQLNATPSVAGTFNYAPASGTVLDAASGQTLSVNFTPSDTTDYNSATKSVTINVNPAPLTITANNASKMLDAPNPAFTATYSGFVSGQGPGILTGTLTCTSTATTTSPVGSYPINCSGQSSSNYMMNYVAGTLKVVYAPAGGVCDGDLNHAILQPVNLDGSSVFKQGSTVHAKFRVCDANGVSVGTPGVVSAFNLVQIVSGTLVQTVDETVDSTTPDYMFRWDSTGQQWIFNISSKSLAANETYVFLITLNDGTAIPFQFGLK